MIDDNALTTDALVRRLDHCNAQQLSALFDDATADQQSEIIRHKLRALQRRLADQDYAALAHLFRRNLRRAVDRSARDATTPRRRTSDACRGRTETLARRAMFSTVLEVESRLEEIVARRRAYVAQQTSFHYHALLSSLIQCDDVETCGTGLVPPPRVGGGNVLTRVFVCLC